MKRFWIVDSIGSGIIFIVIGALFFFRGKLGLEPAAVTGSILIMLYIRGPAEQILNGLPALFQAQVAFRRITSLSKGLSAARSNAQESDPGFYAPERSIRLVEGVYEFKKPDGTVDFRLGPINLTIDRGEIIFVVGENGSGKTTLVKALLGLYPLDSGALEFDGRHVVVSDLPAYRQMFSAVFSDYFLFSDLISVNGDLAERAQAYIEEFEIAHKVDVRDAAFSTIDLSTGQRKRLALIHAYLEQRPIMMFDEWAADQDPTFRRIFYERILPDLKAQGKTLIVVSHDDRFFHLADRVITLHEGLIASDHIPASGAGHPTQHPAVQAIK
jgi:putative ATP-binding cassette transporter